MNPIQRGELDLFQRFPRALPIDDYTVVKPAKVVKPSSRDEFEFITLNNIYLDDGDLSVRLFGRVLSGWFLVGTAALLEALQIIETIEASREFQVGCLEEIRLNNGWLAKTDIEAIIAKGSKRSYRDYLATLVTD